jgi:hypothetical protein
MIASYLIRVKLWVFVRPQCCIIVGIVLVISMVEAWKLEEVFIEVGPSEDGLVSQS